MTKHEEKLLENIRRMSAELKELTAEVEKDGFIIQSTGDGRGDDDIRIFKPITRQQAIQRAGRHTRDIIRYYMGEPAARYERADAWNNGFILWLANVYTENHDNFVRIVADYNKYRRETK